MTVPIPQQLIDTLDDYNFIVDLLGFIAQHDLDGQLFWRSDEGFPPIRFFLNTNDVFCWACADNEPVTAATLPALKQAVADCLGFDQREGPSAGCMLYACRQQKMRPQGACYPKNRALWPLFDACGPERAIDIGNPHQPGGGKP